MKLTNLKPRLSTIATQRVPTQETERLRGRAAVKRRTGRWLMEFTERFLKRNPLCARCSTWGRPVVATQVDHKVALVNGGKDFDEDPGQAQGLCAACHKKKTAEDLGHRIRPTIGPDGWPL